MSKDDLTLINDNLFNVELPHAKLLLTDIPYGEVSRDSGGLRELDKGNADVETFELQPFLNYIYDKADIFVIFCGNEQYSEIYKFFSDKQKEKRGTVRQLIWAKTNPSPMNAQWVMQSATENAVWFKKKGTGLMPIPFTKNYVMAPTGSSKFHPTEKNHKLLEQIIEANTVEGDLIVDTCFGSGSTGLVALRNNRRFFGVELDKEFYDIATNRFRDEFKAE